MLHCEVSIVEFDKELFDFVMTFAKDGVYGNIEDYHWVEKFKGQKYDAVVFADVLEHLTNPEEVLKQVVPFLKEDGQVLITFPNLAHNSVLIDLFNNQL
ncbi:class I SAM-dependent methyltransferase, partial [Enterococcus cecorum]|uniref:class I SAM-dependent methyltransferase n=1 Tax=Enterococcus cecorum TaxID=44008 RepID=UPI001FCD97C4